MLRIQIFFTLEVGVGLRPHRRDSDVLRQGEVEEERKSLGAKGCPALYCFSFQPTVADRRVGPGPDPEVCNYRPRRSIFKG